MAKESRTARLRLVAAALFAVLWTLTVWTVGHHPARATTSLRVLPAAVSRGSSGAARVNGAQADPFVSANPPNTACQCRDLHTCLPTTFKMVPAGQSLKHAPALDFIRFKAKYSEVHRNHKATPARDKPLLRVLMSNFGPDAPTCSLTVFIRGGSTDFVALKQIFVQGEHSYLEHIRHRPQVVLDAGANVGFSSLYFSLLFPGARIYALEPDKENYDMLVRNTAGIAAIHPIHKGLSGTAGTFYVCDRGNGWAVGRFLTPDMSQCPKLVSSIEVTSVPQLVSDAALAVGSDGFDLIKMDIEGGEQAVFSAPDLSWLRSPKFMSLELHERYAPGCEKLVAAKLNAVAMHKLVTDGEYVVYRA